MQLTADLKGAVFDVPTQHVGTFLEKCIGKDQGQTAEQNDPLVEVGSALPALKPRDDDGFSSPQAGGWGNRGGGGGWGNRSGGSYSGGSAGSLRHLFLPTYIHTSSRAFALVTDAFASGRLLEIR